MIPIPINQFFPNLETKVDCNFCIKWFEIKLCKWSGRSCWGQDKEHLPAILSDSEGMR